MNNFDTNGERIVGKMPIHPDMIGKKPKFAELITKEAAIELVLKALELASHGNEVMLKFVLEHMFGKAPQSVDLTSGGQVISFVIPTDIAYKNAINTLAEPSSEGPAQIPSP